MAAQNHKPKRNPFTDRHHQERRIKVSSMPREARKDLERPHATPVKVPWIRMQGKWLEQAGFEVHAHVRIRVMFGCLVLTLD